MAERGLLVEHENLYNLFSLSDYFVTLCSQSGLEACFRRIQARNYWRGIL